MSEKERETCDFCGKEIPEEVVAARHYPLHKPPMHIFCNRQHRAAYDKEHGLFKGMSAAGKTKRSQAVAKSNRENPRRQKKP